MSQSERKHAGTAVGPAGPGRRAGHVVAGAFRDHVVLSEDSEAVDGSHAFSRPTPEGRRAVWGWHTGQGAGLALSPLGLPRGLTCTLTRNQILGGSLETTASWAHQMPMLGQAALQTEVWLWACPQLGPRKQEA